MDKITHQVRAEHWTRILNECMNSGMSKTAWCRANGISEKQFFYWQRILRREAYEASQNPSITCSCRDRTVVCRSAGRYLLLRSNFRLHHQMHHPFSIRIW